MNKMSLSASERQELTAMQRSRPLAVGQARRARLILLLEEGASRQTIMGELRCDSRFVSTWKSRFEVDRLGCTLDTQGERRARIWCDWKRACSTTR